MPVVEDSSGDVGHRVLLELHFPPLPADLDGVSIHVTVEDVGEADVRAPELGRADFTGIRVPRSTACAAVPIELPDLRGAAVPALRVHVDIAGGGRVQSGDFVNPSIVAVPRFRTDTCRIDLVEVR